MTRRILALVTGVALAIGAIPAGAVAASAEEIEVPAPLSARAGTIDGLVFGDPASEQAHDFAGDGSIVVDGQNGLTARVSTPLDPAGARLNELTFTIAVDPHEQNYLTAKTWGEDSSAYKSQVFVDGEQVGYRQGGDWESLNFGTLGGLQNRFLFTTTMLPLESTQGRSEVQIIVRDYAALGAIANQNSRPYYEAFTSTDPEVIAGEPDATSYNPTTQAAPALDATAEQAKIDSYSAKLVATFDALSAKADASPAGRLSIERYAEELRFYAEALAADWSPADTDEKKTAALERIFRSIDSYTKEYYGNVLNLASGGHQSDWGGYYSILGEVLYILEPMIDDDAVYGRERFEQFLAEPFATGTNDGANSIAGVDWNGGALDRKEAWERVLKASFDFSRSRLSYIYNQVLYTYEGAWKAGEGLRVIGSEFYEGKDRSHRIALESLGAAPFLGEEVLVGPDGQGLDLYHDLFRHDNTAVFTDDVLQFVMRGLATSKTDDDGNVVRRLPYGTNYTGITEAGLTRENGYVGGYGEAANYLPNWFYRTLGHTGDEELNQEILKLALRNVHARGQTRYASEDADGNRAMFEQGVIDDRTNAYPGRVAYGVEASKGVGMLFAGLEKYMAEHEADYSGPEWDKSWEYAREAVGFMQQQLADNQFFNHFDDYLLANYEYDLTLPETYRYVTDGRAAFPRFGAVAAGVLLPQTDLARYTDDELAALGVDRTTRVTSSAWVDVDNLLVSARDGDTHLFVSLAERNKGFAGVGRAHVQKAGFDQITQVPASGRFVYDDAILRAPSTEDPIVFDRYATADDRPLANVGEILPITFQPGVGTVSRENFITDTPYSGYPDLATTRYGDYLFAVNTTRAAYGNEQSVAVTLPEDFEGSTVRDLVSGTELAVESGSVQLGPQSAAVLVVGDAGSAVPDAVDGVLVTPGTGSVGLTWNPTSGSTEYTVSRSATEDGTFEPVGERLTSTSYVDTDADAGTWFYRVTAVAGDVSAPPSPAVRAEVTPVRTAQVGAAGWRDDLVGAATVAVSQSDDGDTIAISDADGSGFATGDDNRELERFQPDSLALVSRLAQGGVTVSADLSALGGRPGGVTLRDGVRGADRYVWLGAAADGMIELRARSLDTRSDIGAGKPGNVGSEGGGNQMSPTTVPLEGLSVEQTPYVELVRDSVSQLVTALVSSDGITWNRVGTETIPMADVIHAGVSASNGGEFRSVDIRAIEDGLAVPTVAQTDDQAVIAWNKPKNAIAFDVYRTEEPALAGTDPRGADGQPAAGWTSLLADAYALSVADKARADAVSYAVVSRFADGSTRLGAATASAVGEDIADVLARAKAAHAENWTRGSFYLLTSAITRVETALGETGADVAALRSQLYTAIDALAPRADDAPVDVLATATVTTSHPGHAGSGPKDEIGKTVFDGNTATTISLSSANDGWVQADFGGHPVTLTAVRGYPQAARADTIARMNGAVVAGSNDGVTWSALGTFSGVTKAQWYGFDVTDPTAYRYIRYSGANASYASVSELEYSVAQLDASLLTLLQEETAALDPDDYSVESWAALSDARAAAAALGADASQAEVDAAAQAVLDARNALVPREEPDGPATRAPGVAALSNTSGWVNGLADGNFDVAMNLWWGENATRYELFENGVLIHSERLTDATPVAQNALVPIRSRSNGTYVYTGVLTNRHGATATTSTTVFVNAAAPGVGVLSDDNWSHGADYCVRFDLWWGTNGTTYRLYENDQLVDTRELTMATPQTQAVTTAITGRTAGEYVYRAELENAAGTTTTAPITVTVR